MSTANICISSTVVSDLCFADDTVLLAGNERNEQGLGTGQLHQIRQMILYTKVCGRQ